MASWSHDEETNLAHYLAHRICDKASGRIDLECLRNSPRDVYFIGNLRPQPSNDDAANGGFGIQSTELANKLAPVAFGAEFLLLDVDHPVEVSVQVSWSCYYRVYPSFDQQAQHQHRRTAPESEIRPVPELPTSSTSFQQNGELSSVGERPSDQNATDTGEGQGESPDTVSSARDRRHTRVRQDSLFIRFRKIRCNATGTLFVERSANDEVSANCSDLQVALNLETDRAAQVVASDPERIRTSRNADEKIQVPETSLTSDEAYATFLRSLATEIPVVWSWAVRGAIRPNTSGKSTGHVLTVELVNTSPVRDTMPHVEPFLFDTEATFDFVKGSVGPFEIDLAPHGFRYDRYVWGRGVNCAVERQSSASGEARFYTTHAPIYRQLRYATRTDPPARFADLAANPLPALATILEAMESYRDVWDRYRRDYALSDAAWDAEHGAEFDRDKQSFEWEIEQFRRGLNLIRNNDDVRLAFQLTNEAFKKGHGGKTEWRLFQIVFLVIQMPGVAALATPPDDPTERLRVDIVHFPTGGGKTEAYLATIIFHCFFDRLRGKAAGITAWTRFPLRLLTLQQTQRVADVIGLAELVRRTHPDRRLSGHSADPFAVGYFVGQGGSPNEISNPNELRYPGTEDPVIWAKVNDPIARQEWKRVARCPACGTSSITIDFDAANTRLLHRCTNERCPFPSGVLPIYIVDNEIYRYLPAVLVGTIDKLAGIGNQRKFSQLFGQVDGKCVVHGYYSGKCCQKDCSDSSLLESAVPHGLSGPTLFIQDELHLLKEGLGTFDGHYETFTQRLQREFGLTHPLKIIASSATIEAFARQVSHLYGRAGDRARVFPAPGPTSRESFYAETLNYEQRLYVGVLPHNKTIFNAILELVDLYHRETLALRSLAASDANPYGGSITPGTSAWRTLIDSYLTSLTYFLAGRELNAIRTDLEGDVIPGLQRDSLPPIDISELTGSTSTDDVSRILEKLEQPTSSVSPDAVLATSMISHGVDIDRLNAMIFYGMPRQNAEYIQASSRVGRTHAGIVFTCLHPVRERDQSHYSYFSKFHEFLGQLIEPVAINRWSKFSINRTLPGLFMAVLLQLIANRSGEANPNRYYMLEFVRGKVSDGTVGPDDFIPFLEDAYGVRNPSGPGETAFRDEIRLRVRQYLDWILSPGSGQTFVSEVLIPKPMRSLRDVDDAIVIELDSLGTYWTASRAGRQGA